MTKGSDTEQVDTNCNHIPNDDRAGGDQESVVHPENLEDAHNGRHSGIHAGAGTAFEHREEVWQTGKGRTQTCQEAEDFGAVEPGEEEAGGVARDKVFAATEYRQAQSEYKKHYPLLFRHKPPRGRAFARTPAGRRAAGRRPALL